MPNDANDLVSSLETEVRAVLHGAPFELSQAGLFCHRLQVPKGALSTLEAALGRHGPVRVLDFTHGAHCLVDNAVAHDGADPAAYEGAVGPCGHRLFRVDHHYDVASLRTVSTTPLVLRWLRGLWARGRHELLAEVARSRYLADHADADILLSNFLAAQAENEALLHGPLGAWLAAAALRNDYVRLPPTDTEPEASRIFYACVGIEKEILAGRLRFADAQTQILPQLEPWLSADQERLDPAIGRRLDEWCAALRAEEERTLARIAAWESAGKLTRALDGQLAILEADEKIDNAELYLYLTGHQPPVVQLLTYPAPESESSRVIVKVRSHGGFDLYPLFAALNALVPEGAFGGRAAAGGSRPIAPIPRAELVEAVRRALGRR
jgi:hypothetical protein